MSIVITTSHLNGVSNVNINSLITINFSEVMDASTIINTSSLIDNTESSLILLKIIKRDRQ